MAGGQTFGFPEAALRLTVTAHPLSLGVNAAMMTPRLGLLKHTHTSTHTNTAMIISRN